MAACLRFTRRVYTVSLSLRELTKRTTLRITRFTGLEIVP